MNLKKFAWMPGLSPTTASHALVGYPEVSEATRRQVTDAAISHGYRPNRRTASLATGRTMAIGHVIPRCLNHGMANPVFADFLAGAGEVCSSANYDLILSVVSDGDEAQACRIMAEAGNVDGLIVHGPRSEDRRMEVLRDIGLPFAVHGRFPNRQVSYSLVDIDNPRTFQGATDLLLDLGDRRIAPLNGFPGTGFARRRRDGFAPAMSGRGGAIDPVLLFAGEMSEANGHRATREMLALEAPPTAFLVSLLIMAIGVCRAIHGAGLSLGRDVSVVTHDDGLGYLANGGDQPIFTASRSSVRAAGMRCAEILLARIAMPGLAPTREIWECDLVQGASTGPAPAQQGPMP